MTRNAKPPGDPTDQRPVLSVVVPTRARSTRLLLTLSALRAQILPAGDVEVILVNDAPSREMVDAVLAVLPTGLDLRLVDTGGQGVAHARNAGARLARAPLLLFLDDDTVSSPGLLAAHVAAQQAWRPVVAHSRIIDLAAFAFTPEPWPLASTLVGARGRTIGPADLTDLTAVVSSLGPRCSFIERAVRMVLDGSSGYRALRWLACVGTATSMRRDVFDHAGRFDEHYGSRWGGEDLELGIRLAEDGVDFAIVDAVGYHLPIARRDVDTALPAFWQLVAERHSNPALGMVGEFLCGRCGLDELAGHLAAGRPRVVVARGAR